MPRVLCRSVFYCKLTAVGKRGQVMYLKTIKTGNTCVLYCLLLNTVYIVQLKVPLNQMKMTM